jgi:hypothetical protein
MVYKIAQIFPIHYISARDNMHTWIINWKSPNLSNLVMIPKITLHLSSFSKHFGVMNDQVSRTQSPCFPNVLKCSPYVIGTRSSYSLYLDIILKFWNSILLNIFRMSTLFSIVIPCSLFSLPTWTP